MAWRIVVYTDGFTSVITRKIIKITWKVCRRRTAVSIIGNVLSVADGWAEVEVKNRFSVGDRIEIIHPSGNETVT